MGILAKLGGSSRSLERSADRVQALWQGKILADSDDTIVVEGNHYFPPRDVVDGHLEPSDHHSFCPWKGEASYYDVVAGGERNPQAAWYYPEPKAEAAAIKGYVAFWKGVEVRRARGAPG